MAPDPMAAATPSTLTSQRRAVAGSAFGTLFEWYDFNLFATLAVVLAAQFFAGAPEGMRALFALLVFAVGFMVRPLGALIFGRLSDTRGRRTTFIATVLIMGLSTIAVGLLPGYAEIGILAPVLLLVLRILQGLAVGGEYGGAAVYLAEHVPAGKRGLLTSFVQASITAAFLLSLLLLLALRQGLGEQSFAAWGWRIPFLLAVIPLAISVWMRLRLTESPVFLEMKRKGMLSRSPLRDVFSDRKTVRTMVIVLFGLVAGQAVLGYGGQLYPYLFMLTVLKIDAFTATVLTAWAMAVTCVGFIVFGWLSDLIGRKPVIVAGLILAVATIFPLFHALAGIANPDLERAQRSVAITVASPADCAFQFNPAGTARYGAPCDKVRSLLAAKGAQFASARAVETSVTIGSTRIEGGDPDLAAKLTAALKAAGYPDPGSPGVVEVRSLGDILHPQALAMIAILSILGLYSAMVYAPLAAYLVELFPPQIRTTALSLPYHIGNGWIGGLLPPTAVALVIATGNPYAGLWYPVTFAALSAVVSVLFLRGRDDRGEG